MSSNTPLQGSPRAIVDWLSAHPAFDEVARVLVTEYARRQELCPQCAEKLATAERYSTQRDTEFRGKLSQRQLAILQGMVEGKTNHELANELGFSVSTIRHETMRIYEILAVSDRKEAAKKALALSLI